VGRDPTNRRSTGFPRRRARARLPEKLAIGDAPRNINYDWNEPAKVIKVGVDQGRARALSSQRRSNSINAVPSATRITQLRDATYLVDIIARAVPKERAKLETLRNLSLAISGGHAVPLSQIATLSYTLESPLIWRRQRLPT
jgi:multidrug efflux pump